jgi:hypothetical protein
MVDWVTSVHLFRAQSKLNCMPRTPGTAIGRRRRSELWFDLYGIHRDTEETPSDAETVSPDK